MEGRRVALVYLDAEQVASACFAAEPGEWTQCVRGLPDGARRVGAGYDYVTDRFWLAFEHDSFPLTHPGYHIAQVRPDHAPEYRRLHGRMAAADILAGRVGADELRDLFGLELTSGAVCVNKIHGVNCREGTALGPPKDMDYLPPPDSDPPHVVGG